MNLIFRVGVLAWLTPAVGVFGCSVPVFRYALERWPADIYRVTVFHRGAFLPEQQAGLDALRRAGEDGLANLAVRSVDVDGEMPRSAAEIWNSLGKVELPWVVVQYPITTGLEQPFAQGPLRGVFVEQILDSPVRRQVRDRILGGDSAVWLLLESGDRKRDDRVEKQLLAESKKLAEILEIPPVDPNDPRTEVNVTLKVGFSVVRLSRAAPAEEFFVRQLVNMHPRLAAEKGPVVFPIFGRGRALCGLAGNELTVENIQEIAVFLTGACSCEVKAMNPGVDLLFAAEWDAALEGGAMKDLEMPPLVSLSQMAAGVQTPPGLPPAPVTTASGAWLARSLIVVVGLGILGVAAGSVWLRRKSRRK
ncbi:MAG: hypothetical protein N3B01_04340 [Verrucomicrobiae bacterium]|nr:hypothetical protein [Verrucomicrobiae bacterium]